MLDIIYKDESGQITGTMRRLDKEQGLDRDGAVLIAQKYLQQFPNLTAHVMTADTETVVSRATEWQKRNG